MKKIMIIISIILFSLVIVGCGEVPSLTTAATTTASSQTTAQTTTGASQSTTGVQTTTESTFDYTGTGVNCFENPDDPACGFTGTISLSYADWGDSVLNEALAAAFEEKYPNIEVNLRKDITGTGDAFTGNLIKAQAAGILPDVFAIDNVPTGVAQGMLLDVSPYWDTDPEVLTIYPNIRDTAIYNGLRLAMPSFMFVQGMYVNKTLLETYGITIPDKDWDYEEFVDLATQLKVAGSKDYVNGFESWTGSLNFFSLLPMQDYADMGYNTWDGTQFHFTSQAWIDAYNYELQTIQQGIMSYTDEELAAIGEVWPWNEGMIGFRLDGSWALWMVDQMWDDSRQDVGFWPFPGGAAGQHIPAILDYICVSSQTDHPYQAYLLAKWMTWGREGWEARIEAMKERGDLYLTQFPIIDDDVVWGELLSDDYNFIDYIDGLRETVELLPEAKPDVDKWLPGYKSFWEWVGNEENDYWNKISEGLVTPEVFAADWETKINQMVSDAMASIGLDEEQ